MIQYQYQYLGVRPDSMAYDCTSIRQPTNSFNRPADLAASEGMPVPTGRPSQPSGKLRSTPRVPCIRDACRRVSCFLVHEMPTLTLLLYPSTQPLPIVTAAS